MRPKELIKTNYIENENTSLEAFQIKAKEFLVLWHPFRGPLMTDLHPRSPVHDRESLSKLAELYSKIEQLNSETTIDGLSVGSVYRKINPELGLRNLLILSIKEEVIGYFDQLYAPSPKEPETKI